MAIHDGQDNWVHTGRGETEQAKNEWNGGGMRDVGEMTKSTMEKSHPLFFIVVTVDTSYILGIVNLPTTRTETSALYHGHVVQDTRNMRKTCDMLSFCMACLPMGVWGHCARITDTQRRLFSCDTSQSALKCKATTIDVLGPI